MIFKTEGGHIVFLNEDSFESVTIDPDLGYIRADRGFIPTEISPGYTQLPPQEYNLTSEDMQDLLISLEDDDGQEE